MRYLDQYQSTNHATEPKAFGGCLPLSKVTGFARARALPAAAFRRPTALSNRLLQEVKKLLQGQG